MWFEYDQVTQDCQCIGQLFLNCEGEIAHTNTHHIFTYNSNKEVISTVKMRHKYYLEGYNLTMMVDGLYGIQLPNDISGLNEYM